VTVLVLTILVVIAALFVLFWGLAVLLQGYLYNEPATRLPARAAVAALIVGGAIGVWTYANAKSDRKGKYGPLHDFDSTTMTDVYEFVAVRKYPGVKGPDGQPKEEKATFRRPEGQRTAAFVDEKDGKAYFPSTSNYVTVAFEVKAVDGKVGRFDAVTDPKDPKGLTYLPDKRFAEKGTKRHMDGDAPGAVYSPSTKVMIFALLLNVLNYVAWFVAFWLAMRFAFPHAVGLAVVFGLLTMLVAGPLLFERVRPKDGPTRKIEVPTMPTIPTMPVVPDDGNPPDRDKK
jgi:hypothetical protein